MVKQNSMVNLCFCQGIIRGQIYAPAPSIAKINVMVRSTRKNPKTRKREIQLHNFVAYGFDAAQIASTCHDGSVVFLTYHVESNMRINRKTGVATMIEENIIDSLYLHPEDLTGKIPYLNICFFQGIYLGINKQLNSEGIYVLDAYTDMDDGGRVHMKFFVYGDEQARIISETHQKGDRILIEYQIEKSRRQLKDGKTEYFTNRVVERVG